MTFLSKFFARRQLRKDVHFVRLPVQIVINPSRAPDVFAKYDKPSILRRTAKVIRLPLPKPDHKRQAV